MSSSQLRRCTQQPERSGPLLVRRESSSPLASFAHSLELNAIKAAITAAYEALQEINIGLTDLKHLAATIDGKVVQLERRINQLFEKWQ